MEYDNMLQQDPPLDPVLASPHTDMWPLGAILYYLCTGETLFLNNDSDNTDNKSLLQLYAWTKDFKEEKLLKISDKLARNLVSRLLNKDSKKRPLTSAGNVFYDQQLYSVCIIPFIFILVQCWIIRFYQTNHPHD
jgi:serine/threonine protein kinase